MEETPVVDYTDEIGLQNTLAAQGRGTNFLRLERLEEPFRRADGVRARYLLEYRWLSMECRRPDDEAYVCVLGSENTFWTESEIKGLLADIKAGRPVVLFGHFNLF